MAKKLQKKKVLKKKFSQIIRFLIVFNLFLIPLYTILWLNLSYQPLQNFLASSTAYVLKTRGFNVKVDGSTINLFLGLQLQRIQISWDSTGWKSMYTLIALVLATPTFKLAKRFTFLLYSVPTIFFLNFLRIVTTILFAINYGFEYFELLHMLIWREGMILAVVILWFLFLKGKI